MVAKMRTKDPPEFIKQSEKSRNRGHNGLEALHLQRKS